MSKSEVTLEPGTNEIISFDISVPNAKIDSGEHNGCFLVQEKKLNNTDLTELPNVEESIDFFFESVNIPRTKQILKLDINELKIQDKILSRNIKLDVIGNKHICIML